MIIVASAICIWKLASAQYGTETLKSSEIVNELLIVDGHMSYREAAILDAR